MKPEPELVTTDADLPVDRAKAEPLVGVRAWPDAQCSYWLSGTGKEPMLTVTVAAQPGGWLPGPADSPHAAAARAAEHAERYRLVRAQLDDPGVAVSLLTTLDPGLVLPVADGAESLRRFAAAAELFVQAAAGATPPKLTGLATLGELMDRYGISAERLATANVDQPLNRLLAAGQPLAVRTGQIEPDTVPADASTLAAVAVRLRITPERLLEDNRGLQLSADSAFVLPGIVTLPADARTLYATQAGDTLAALARRFGTTARQIVADNAEVTGTLRPGIGVAVSVGPSGESSGEGEIEADDEGEIEADDEAEIGAETEADDEAADQMVTASTDTVTGDSFQSLRARLVEQNAEVTLDAVADALDRLGAVLTMGAMLSCPLAVLGSSRDSGTATPLTGAEVSAEHGCSPVDFAAANAAVLGLLQPGVRLSVDDSTTSTAECDTLTAVLGRLTPAEAAPSIARLIAANSSVPLFRAGARALLPPPPVSVTASLGQPLEPRAPAARLAVTLRLQRPSDAIVDPAAGAVQAEPPAERADTVVPPSGDDRDSFVDDCLTALPDVRLATDASGELWAVAFGSTGIAGVHIEPSAGGTPGPRVFALRPLYRQLLDFSASIRPVTAQGGLGMSVRRQFSQLDVEYGARSFVTELDRYLAEPLSNRLPGTARGDLLAVRRRVAEAIPGSLAPLPQSQPDSPPVTEALANARTALASIGRQSLAQAYLSSVVAQYRAVVVAPYPAGGQAARLAGTLQASGRADLSLSSSRTELDPSNATCTFALANADPSDATSVSFTPEQVFDAIEVDLPQPGESSTEPVLLRFARALAGGYRVETVAAGLPATELPIPLREHPAPVSAQPMTAQATFTGPGLPTLAEATRWTSSLSYTHEHAAQDVVLLGMSPPVAAPATEAADSEAADSGAAGSEAAGDTALAEALAGYTAASVELAVLIGSDVESPDGTDAATVRGNAAASLVELATAVAAAWSAHGNDYPAADSDPVDPRLSSTYRLRAVYSDSDSTGDGGRRLDRLVVSRTGIENGIEDGWPGITLISHDGELPLTPGPVADETREYAASHHLAGTSPLTLRLDWPGLRGAPGPDARIALTVERNPTLGAGMATSAAFVLAARPIQVEVTSPSVRWSEQIPLTGDSLGQALQNAFDTLSAEQPENIRLSIEARYAEPVGEQHTVLAVLLIPELALQPDSAGAIAAALEDWQRAYHPATAGARWHLGLAVLSAHPGALPLLAFDQLVFPVPLG
ncbi:LysM peptidoglycan-binding domain-containing protein [Jatrophihabitans sp.]|uniref:LysM peptidoglycan-binding domain-containing protein n=1 Tax=Jatrophihabitans sp. TaxID=1932789 RepID=UPI002F0811EA